MLSQINQEEKTISFKLNHSFGGLNFFDIYEIYFEKIKDKKINILEIGVFEGVSLRIWKKYFPNASIYGLDIDPDCKKHEEDRIYVETGSQIDKNVIDRLVARAGSFDIIIDDGSHVNKYTIQTFKMLFPHLVSKGIYAIEDLHCCYEPLDDLGVKNSWPGMSYNIKEDNINNNIKDFHKFINDVFDDLNYQKEEILSMQFWSRICLFLKK